MEKKRVLVVEDQTMPRQLFELLIAESEDFTLAAAIDSAELADVYCLRSVPFGAGADGLCQLAAAAVVVIVHLARRSTLLSIAAGTAAYMLLIRVIPPSIPL